MKQLFERRGRIIYRLDSAMMLFDQTVDDLAVRREGAKSRLFIGAHQAAVAVDVGAEDRGELAFHSFLVLTALRNSARESFQSV